MSYLDNSGNIILDACLTDTGRFRLAKGDGSFKIAKFALGDDEVVYSQYNKSHPSGSAYFDLSIMQTPIFEAFTNNTSTMNSKLITIARTNLLYLPVIKLNDLYGSFKRHAVGSHVIAVDSDTETSFSNVDGVMMGETLNGGAIIRVDQGLDTTEISYAFTIDSDLVETQYILEIDNRFAKVIGTDGTVARMSFIDDDNIASYYLSLGTDNQFVTENTNRNSSNNEAIAGPRGTILQFKLQSSIELNTSTYLFEQMGSTTTMNSTSVYYIDSYIKISGATTGYQLELPVRFIKNA